MDEPAASAILADYDQQRDLFQAFTGRLHALIEEILQENSVRVHSVSHRVKNRESLWHKLLQPDRDYERLADITDVCGIRITTYFADEVDAVAELIKREFTVDHTVDKRASLGPDQFGYLSLHQIVSMSPTRSALVEYRRFPMLKAEIQTRSILQHAWAEIEHDLAYKMRAAVPRESRRRFSRVAGLLELADQEFTALRADLAVYEKSVSDRIRMSPQSVFIDKLSLRSFARIDSQVRALNSQIAQNSHTSVRADEEEMDDFLLENVAVRLQMVGVNSIGELADLFIRYEPVVVRFAKKWLGPEVPSPISRLTSVLYFSFVLAADRRNVDELAVILARTNTGFRGGPVQSARAIAATVAEAKAELESPEDGRAP